MRWAVNDLPPVQNTMVYDWRIGVPSLMQLIALRLQIIAAVLPEFKTTGHIDSELRVHRDALLSQYTKMVNGVRCGYQEYVFDKTEVSSFDFSAKVVSRYREFHVECVDIHTEQAARDTFFYDEQVQGCDAFCAAQMKLRRDSTFNQINAILPVLRREVMRSLPLFEMRSLIDTLAFYSVRARDLTAHLERIAIAADPRLCLDVQFGNPNRGTPTWLWPCDGNAAQRWRYDRITGLIRNTAYNKCLDVQWGSDAPGTAVWTWDCTGDNAQRWTYDPIAGVLQNALGTVLDVQWGNIQSKQPVWTWQRNEGAAQRWWADQPPVTKAPIPVQ